MGKVVAHARSARPVRGTSGLLAAASSAAALLFAVLATTGCGKSPVKPGDAAAATFPNVSIVSLSVASETQSSGSRMYRVTVKLRESAGVPATIAAIDLSFASASSVVVSSHVDRPISDTSNICPANSMVDSRELTVKDDDPSHAHATSVTATVVFGNGSSATKTVSASTSVPESSPPPPQVFTLTGVVSDDRTGAPIAMATVQTVGGANGGKSSSTDGNGSYSIPGLTGGSVTIRAAANGYDTIEQVVTIAADVKIDLKLRATGTAPPPPPPPPPPSAPCAYTISPSSNSLTWMGGTFSVTITRTSGSCSWQATSNVSWITFTAGASGSGSGTLTYFVMANGGVVTSNTRFGTVTITWSGGSADLAVEQGGASPELCRFTIAVGGSSSVTVPSAGGQVSATVTWVNTGIPPSVCTGTASSEDSWITFVPPSPAPMFGAGGGTLTISVSPNPLPGFARSGTVSIRSFSGSVSITVTQQ